MNKDERVILQEVELNMRKIRSIFSKLMDEYHRPVDFVAQADALIQALRNFTFFLQSKKNSIGNFDEWYSPWQESMRSNPYMRFIVEMRNSIVKQGINTAKSHALIVLLTDYRQTLLERRLDVYTTTAEIRDEFSKLTKKNPSLKHATGEIHRLYIFNYAKKDDLEVVDTLFYCTVFIRELFDDFKEFMNTGSIQTELPNVIAPSIDVGDLKMTFRMRDGREVEKNVIRVKRNEKAIKAYREKHGDLKLEHDYKSEDVHEKLLANVELAQKFKQQFDDLLPSLEYYSTTLNEWVMIHPMVNSRADKILFWSNFAEHVIEYGVDKFYFTADGWMVSDKEGLDRAIRTGKEVSTLPNLKECLIAYYLDCSGRVTTIQSLYAKQEDGRIVFQEAEPEEGSPAHNAMFSAVFAAWGIKV